MIYRVFCAGGRATVRAHSDNEARELAREAFSEGLDRDRRQLQTITVEALNPDGPAAVLEEADWS